MDNIVNSCHFLLFNYPDAFQIRDYLNSRLTEESQIAFKFGYFPSLDQLEILKSLVPESELIKYKLLFKKEILDSSGPSTIDLSYFHNYPLVMPIRDIYGKTIAMVGRTILDEASRQKEKISKYKYTINFTKSSNVFGLYENKDYIFNSDCVYVVEGQIDVIKSKERGYHNMVGLGGSSMSPYQFSLITRYTNNIYLLLDNDEAGIKGRKLIMDRFGKYANIVNFYLPDEYKDVDEYFSKNDTRDLDISMKY